MGDVFAKNESYRKRRKIAGDAVEQRGLAGAVRTKHRATSPGRTVMVTSVSAARRANIRVTPRSSSPAPAPTANSHGRRYPWRFSWRFDPAGRGRVMRRRHCSQSPTTPSDDQNTMARKPRPIQKPERCVEPELDQEVSAKCAG